MQRLQKNSTKKIATEATEKSQMKINLDTTDDQRQIQNIIRKQTLEETKIFTKNSIALKTLLTQ